MSAVKDITGQRFGRLTVLQRFGTSSQGTATWLCLCDCGKECVIEGAKMRKGNTRSCGCLHDEKARERRTTHGMSDTRLYHVWKTMNPRCSNPNSNDYKDYGGRGITVCEEWQYSFPAFHAWAIANGYDENAPQSQCTIDRINNDRGYSPQNCRWVDQKTQCNNRNRKKG